MENDIAQLIQTRLLALPEDVQRAIQSADLSARIQNIGQKHQLHIDQMGNLEDETLLVMLGFTDPGDFSTQLQKQVNLTQEKAELLASDVSNEIFVPIRESMEEFTEQQAILNSMVEQPSPNIQSENTPPETTSASIPPSPLPPQKTPEVHPAELVLTQKTISIPPSAPISSSEPAKSASQPPIPPQYKTDPYREPPE